MRTVTITNARKELYNLIDDTIKSSVPLQITAKRGNAILISEDDWRAIQETMYLLSVPGMRESVIAGLKTPLNETSEEPGW